MEIGCVELKNHLPTGQTYQAYINPERSMDPGAVQVSGITDDFLVGKPFFRSVAKEFLEFIEDSPLVIHNAAFDMSFINGELSLLNKNPLSFDRAVDTVKIARDKFPGSPANLDALCRRFEIDLSSRTKHGALLDAQLLAEVYLQLVGGRQFGLNLDKSSKQSYAMVDLSMLPKKAPRDFSVSEEDLQKHETFIGSLKNPLWKKAQ